MNDVMLVNVQLPRDVDCAASARRAVERGLRELVSPHVLDDVRTVVTELAAIAFRDGGGRMVLRVGMLGRRLRIDLVDGGPQLAHGTPGGRPVDSRAVNGHAVGGAVGTLDAVDGLRIVEEIALACGVEAGGSRAWAELPLDG